MQERWVCLETPAGVKLGLQCTPTTDEVVRVVADSPADQAGLRPGDKLLSVSGQPSGLSVVQTLATERRDVRMLRVAREEDGDESGGGGERQQQLCVALRRSEAGGLQLSVAAGGLVRAVAAGGVAEAAGLRAGDTIVEVDGVELDESTTAPEFAAMLPKKEMGPFYVLVLRDRPAARGGGRPAPGAAAAAAGRGAKGPAPAPAASKCAWDDAASAPAGTKAGSKAGPGARGASAERPEKKSEAQAAEAGARGSSASASTGSKASSKVEASSKERAATQKTRAGMHRCTGADVPSSTRAAVFTAPCRAEVRSVGAPSLRTETEAVLRMVVASLDQEDVLRWRKGAGGIAGGELSPQPTRDADRPQPQPQPQPARGGGGGGGGDGASRGGSSRTTTAASPADADADADASQGNRIGLAALNSDMDALQSRLEGLASPEGALRDGNGVARGGLSMGVEIDAAVASAIKARGMQSRLGLQQQQSAAPRDYEGGVDDAIASAIGNLEHRRTVAACATIAATAVQGGDDEAAEDDDDEARLAAEAAEARLGAAATGRHAVAEVVKVGSAVEGVAVGDLVVASLTRAEQVMSHGTPPPPPSHLRMPLLHLHASTPTPTHTALDESPRQYRHA